MCAGHAQELKTQAIALQAGKRLRIFFSDNNAGIDDALLGGVVQSKFDGYVLRDQWTSYGWNVFTIPDGHDYEQILDVLKTMEDWDPADRRPMIVIGKTTKGYWPARCGNSRTGDQIVGYPSHPFGFKMNAEYIVALARTFEAALRREVRGNVGEGRSTDTRERLLQFKTNIDVAMSVLDKNGLGDWLADRLVEIGDTRRRTRSRCASTSSAIRSSTTGCEVANLPVEPQSSRSKNSVSGREKTVKVALFRKPGEAAGARRAISEIIKWLNYVTDNRVLTAGRGSLGVGQPRARQPLGPLRSGDEPARHAAQGRDSGSRQRLDRDRSREPERLGRSGQVRRRLGVQRHLRRVHAADVSAGARLEPAESGQQVPDGRPAHPRGAFRARRPRPTRARTSASSRRRCGSCSRAATSST